MIYRKEKALWWCLKLAVVALAAWLLPGVTYKNALVIGFLLWFLFDCFMGYKIHRNIKYTGTESVLDILADSEPWYFWTKFFLIIASIIFYFV